MTTPSDRYLWSFDKTLQHTTRSRNITSHQCRWITSHQSDFLSVKHGTYVPCRLCGADEELRPVGVGAGVGHGQDAGAGVFQGEVLICELVAIDGLSSGSIVVGEIAAL